MEHMSRSSQQSQESRRVINISGVERVFEVRFVDFPDGMTEYVIGDEMDQARRCLRVDDYSGSTDGLPTDSWVLTLVAPGYGSQTLTRILDIPAGRTLTVVSRGTLFRGSVDDPAGFAAVATDWPIRSARTYPQAGLAVLATDCSATCVDANGVRWRSRRLAYDGVVLGDLEDGILHIEAEDYDPRTILLSIDDGHIVHHYKPLPID